MTPGQLFRQALLEERPLQIPGAINANHALLAKHAGYRALYLSGGGVAAGSLGLPDLGISGLEDVLVDVRRITDVCDLPLLVDVDTGFGASAFNVARTVRSLIKAGAGAMHIEDQVGAKRCGHRPGKEIVGQDEMVDRIKAAVDGRTDASFFIMARTDSLAVEGFDRAVERAIACVEAGADGIFPEALTELSMFEKFSKAVGVTHQAVYQWLRRGWLTPKRAEQVSELYGVPAAELLNPEITKLVRVTDVADVAQDLL